MHKALTMISCFTGILLSQVSMQAFAYEDIAGIYPPATFENEARQSLQQEVFIFSAVDDKYYAIVECETRSSKSKTLILPVSMNEKSALFQLQDHTIADNSCPKGTYQANFDKLYTANNWQWQKSSNGDLVRISLNKLSGKKPTSAKI